MFSRCTVCSRRVGRSSGGFTSHGPNSDAGPGAQVSTADVRQNWQSLSDPNRHTDPWDIVKYLQLADGMFASFGGEARES